MEFDYARLKKRGEGDGGAILGKKLDDLEEDFLLGRALVTKLAPDTAKFGPPSPVLGLGSDFIPKTSRLLRVSLRLGRAITWSRPLLPSSVRESPGVLCGKEKGFGWAKHVWLKWISRRQKNRRLSKLRGVRLLTHQLGLTRGMIP